MKAREKAGKAAELAGSFARKSADALLLSACWILVSSSLLQCVTPLENKDPGDW